MRNANTGKYEFEYSKLGQNNQITIEVYKNKLDQVINGIKYHIYYKRACIERRISMQNFRSITSSNVKTGCLELL